MAGQKANKSTPRLNQANIQTSAYGVAIARGWGTGRVSPNLVWLGPLSSKAVKNQTGGKGGAKSTSYDYWASMIMACMSGPITGIKEVFKDQGHFVDGDLHTRYTNIAAALSAANSAELAADYTTMATLCSAINTGTATALQSAGLSLATGELGQAPQPFLTGDDAIGYSLLAYVYAQNYALSSQATLPSHTFTVSTTVRAVVGTQILDDANPADMITDFLENDYFAVSGWPSGAIGDLTEFRTASAAYSLFLSHILDSQTSAASVIEGLCEASNAAPFFSEGFLKVRPYTDTAKTANGVTFTPDLTPIYSLTDDDFIKQDDGDPVNVKVKDVKEAYNYAQITYQDRTHQYNSVTMSQPDTTAIAQNGTRREPPVTLNAIKMPSVAAALARLRVQRTANIWETYTFTLGPEFALLEPMDLIEITSVPQFLFEKLVRITSVDDGGDMINIECEEMLVGASSPPLLAHAQPLTVITDYDVAPGPTSDPILINPPRSITTGDGMEAWLAATGGLNWGGAQVWVSFDAVNYSYVGNIQGRARYGNLTAALPIHADPDTVNTLAVGMDDPEATLSEASEEAADAGATMCLVDNELIAYAHATLTGTATYDLTYLRRGLNKSPIEAHSIGGNFVRVDDAIFRYVYSAAQIGQTIHIKLPAFNVYGRAQEELSDAAAYSIVLNPGAPTFTAVYSDGTPIDDLRPAEPGADVTGDHTSNDTANVGGVPVDVLLNDLDNTALESLNAALEVQNLQGWMQALAYDPNGKSIQTVSIDAKNVADNAITTLNLIGALSADKSAFVFNMTAVKVDADTSFAEYITGVQSSIGGNTASITELFDTTDGLSANVTLVTNVNGHVTGVKFGTTGTTGQFDIITTDLRIIDNTNPANIKVPFAYADDQLYLTNTNINGNLVVTGTITNDQFDTNAALVPVLVKTTADFHETVETPILVLSGAIVFPADGLLRVDVDLIDDYTGVSASGKFSIDVWVDGVKKKSSSGNVLDFAVNNEATSYSEFYASGTHVIDIYWTPYDAPEEHTLKIGSSVILYGFPKVA